MSETLSDVLPKEAAAANPQGEEANPSTEGENGKWTDHLPKEFRENADIAAKFTKFEKLEDFAKAYLENTIPPEDADERTRNAFYEKLGVPKEPKGYALAKNQEAADFLTLAHHARLTDAQASALYEITTKTAVKELSELQNRQVGELNATEAALRKEYGSNYEKKAAAYKRALGDGQAKKLLTEYGLLGNPEIVKAFIALGELQTEDFSPSPKAHGNGKDPMDGDWF